VIFRWEPVREIIARELNVNPSELTDEKLLREDLAIDSIIALNIIFGLERELSIAITEEQIVSVRTVGDLKSLVTHRT